MTNAEKFEEIFRTSYEDIFQYQCSHNCEYCDLSIKPCVWGDEKYDEVKTDE